MLVGRPHPRLGTVELRAPDAQTESWRVASLAALAQCLVATANEHPPEDPLFTEENKGRAARYGLDACLHDFSSGRRTQVRETVRTLTTELRTVSQDLGCEAELDGLLEITGSETGAEEQRAVYRRRRSMKDVVGHLAAETA